VNAPELSIAHHFAALEDPRIDRTKKHSLQDILVIALCAVLGGADSFDDIEEFGRSKREWLGLFLELPNGIPSHDTFGRVFAALNPKAFQACFFSWMNAVCDRCGLKRLAIDGKTLKGSHAKGSKGQGCLHTVSVWASEVGLTLGQEAVEADSNEIPALPRLLATLDLAGAIVTIDAIGCQKEVAAAIRREGGDYVLAVKENQEALYRDVVACIDKAAASDFARLSYDLHQTSESGHGRREERTYLVLHDPAGLTTRQEWAGLKSVVLVQRRRWVGDEYSEESHYYISSGSLTAEEMARSIRGHWGIENGLHWVLDVVFHEDQSRVKDRNAAENLALLRRVAVSLLKQDKSKGSLKGKRKRAGWDEAFLLHLLGFLTED
jgi:predicted transposase YbfD/YdcC